MAGYLPPARGQGKRNGYPRPELFSKKLTAKAVLAKGAVPYTSRGMLPAAPITRCDGYD